jgi:uroporphyrin-3 C-methyltransferase
MVAEAVYLIRLASNRMQFAHDITTARAALAQADQRLKDTRDPSWEDIRERLATDISALDAAFLPDYAALTERLDGLIMQLPLTRVSKITTATQSSEPTRDTTHQVKARDRSLSNLFDHAFSGLQNAVRIRRHDQPLQPLPGSAQEFFHNQNLQLQLTTAQLAVARRQPALYHRSLQRAGQVLAELGAAGHQAAQAMRGEIDNLAAIDIAPPLPNLGATLHALQTRHERRNRVSPGANSGKPAEGAG